MKRRVNIANGLAEPPSVIPLVTLLLLAMILFVGCDSLFERRGAQLRRGDRRPYGESPQQFSSEATFLLDIAKRLGIEESPGRKPDEIAFDIEQRLNQSIKYRGGVMSSKSFGNVKDAILNSEDQEKFQAYHDFIHKVDGKRILIIE